MKDDLISYIAILALFVTIMTPLILGIIHYSKENKKLDEARRMKKSQGPELKTVKRLAYKG